MDFMKLFESWPVYRQLTGDDKLGRGQQSQTLAAVRKELSSAFGDSVGVQVFSSESKQGVDQARTVVQTWLDLMPAVAAE